MGTAAAGPTPDAVPSSQPAAVDISGMPDPPDDLVGTATTAASAPAPDISGMPDPPPELVGTADSLPSRVLKGAKAGLSQAWNSSPLAAAAEVGLNAATGAIGQIGGFLAHVGTLLGTQDPEAAKAVRDAVQDTLTYQPRTPGAQAAEQTVSAAMKAAWTAAKGPQAKAAVDNAMRVHFGDSATDALEAGAGMAGEAAQAVGTAAGVGEMAGSAAAEAVGDLGVGAPHVAPTGADIRGATQPNMRPAAVATVGRAATPPVQTREARPVTGADLRNQPDPFAEAPAAAATPAAEPTPTPAAHESGPAQAFPGGATTPSYEGTQAAAAAREPAAAPEAAAAPAAQATEPLRPPARRGRPEPARCSGCRRRPGGGRRRADASQPIGRSSGFERPDERRPEGDAPERGFR